MNGYMCMYVNVPDSSSLDFIMYFEVQQKKQPRQLYHSMVGAYIIRLVVFRCKP